VASLNSKSAEPYDNECVKIEFVLCYYTFKMPSSNTDHKCPKCIPGGSTDKLLRLVAGVVSDQQMQLEIALNDIKRMQATINGLMVRAVVNPPAYSEV
jgi:hypothetical protein